MIKISPYHFKFHQKVLALCLWVFLALGTTKATAQFIITENFRGNGNSEIVIGDGAYLTSGIDDPVNAGWLRMTKAEANKKGYAYIDKTFPSTMGVLIDFEYKMWRNAADGYNGADGIGVFLFDANSAFALGNYGGSLGYTPGSITTTGLAGGYVGIGLDAYGNFANPTDGPKRGGPGERPNSIVLRGPTTTNNTNGVVGGIQPTNRYLAGVTIRTNNTTGVHTLANISTTGDRTENALDYNTVVSTRPGDGTFYRRMQIEIVRLDASGIYYKIIVRWKPLITDLEFTELVSYTTTDVPPALLKMGFAAATGGGYNYHEIRNLLVTTPGNVRVVKRADKDLLQLDSEANKTITYNIEITNDTDIEVSNISFLDKITDAYGGNLIEGTDYNIESITPLGFVSTALPDAATLTTNEISGTLVLGARKTGRITIVAKLLRMPQGNVLTNTVTADPPFDEDRNNNTSVIRTPVVAENVDLILTKMVTEECINTPATAPVFTTYVSNIGALGTSYNRLGTPGTRIAIYNTVPAGYTYDDTPTGTFAGSEGNPDNGTTGPRWSKLPNVNNPDGSTTYRYVARGPESNTTGATDNLAAGALYNYPIKYKVTPPVGVTTYTDVSKAMLFTDNNYNSSIETAANQLNNTSSIVMNLKPAAPSVPAGTIYYCVDETAAVLTATKSDPSYTLRWYSTPNGFSSDYPITPSTTFGGSYTYYVSQVNGNCEGPQTSIPVVVLSPTVGAIGGAAIICSGTGKTITSTTAGTGGIGAPASGNTITYRWQKAPGASGGEWQNVSGSGATLATGNLTETTRFRRFTILTTAAGKTCESTLPSNEVVVTIPVAGTIGNAQTSCNNSINAAILTTIASSPSGTPSAYQWRRATSIGGTYNLVPDGQNDTDSSTEDYDPASTTTTYFYQRTETYGSCTVKSNIIKITRNATAPTAGTIVGQTICNGDIPTIVSGTAPGGDILTYQWSSSLTSGGTYTVITGAVSETYTPTAGLTASRWYKRTVANTCGSAETAGVQIFVQIVPSPGSIGPSTQTICYNSTAGTITSTGVGAGSQATPTYRWESAVGTTGNVWNPIVGVATATYSPGVLTSSMRYRRYTVSTVSGKACESVATPEVMVIVKTATEPKTISPSSQSVCMDTPPAVLTGPPGAGQGAITYQWQYSLDGLTNWMNISSGGTGISYSPPPTAMYYRRGTLAGGSCIAYTDPVLVTIRNCKVITNPMIYQRVN